VLAASLTCLLCHGTLLKELESALLRLVASSEQELLGGLCAEGVLATADNPAVLVLHEILLCQTTSGLIRSAMPYLCLGTSCHFLY
jgi:hypothetical protein